MKSSIHYGFLNNEIKRFLEDYCRINGKMLMECKCGLLGAMGLD